MCLVGDDDHVVARGVGLAGAHLLVELLDEREHMALVLTQERFQMRPARGTALVLVVINDSASRERLVDLSIQLIAVCQNQERVVSAELAVHLAREIDHRIALARTLRVPEHAQLAGIRRGRSRALPFGRHGRARLCARLYRLHCAVHAEELVVAGEDLRHGSRRLVIDDEILEEVEQIRLGTCPLQQRLHVHRTWFVLGKTLPGMKELELGGVRTDLRIDAVCENHERVEVEYLRHDLAVIAEVVAVGDGDVLRDVLQLHEDERHAVHKPDDIRTAATAERTAQPQFAYAEKMILVRIVEVEDAQRSLLLHAVRRRVANGDAVEKQLVLLAVDGVKSHRDGSVRKDADGIVVCSGGQTWIQFFERGTQIAHQQHLAFVRAPQRPRRSEDLLHGIDALVPVKRIDQILRRRLLHQIVFGIDAHVHPSFWSPT